MLKKSVLLVLAALLLTVVIFAVWPQLDLAVARYFYGSGQFAGSGNGERLLRRIFILAPLAVPLAMLVMWAAPFAGVRLRAALVPGNRSMVFVLVSLPLTPGLLVNVILKDNSARPRPVHVKEFGGPAEFRPWYRFDGACRSNCSFVSGEVSSSTWLAAPASLVPAPYRTPAIAAALAFGAATAYLRIAFGGHFLSDVLFAFLLTLLAILLLHALIMRKKSPHR